MTRRPPLFSGLTAVALTTALISSLPRAGHAGPVPHIEPDDTTDARVAPRSGLGRSGALRVAVVEAFDHVDLPFAQPLEPAAAPRYRWLPMLGTQRELAGGLRTWDAGFEAPGQPGIWRLMLVDDEGRERLEDVAVITKVPFARKQGRFLNGYHIGVYPTENGHRDERYAPPVGFIEVTPENQDMYISQHFRLRQFLTKDQHDVWPKYVVIDMRLIDKLELVMQELNAMGVRAERMHVMSGFRTPQYNGPGGNGRALLSRHTFGDAADVWVDNEGDGYISDLNGDGRRDIQDVALILRAVERVERRYPELVGGAGLYGPSGARSPFIHIDVRGTPSRW